MRGVRLYWGGFVALALLAGCGRGWFEEREPWRREAEQQCIKSGVVKQSAAVTLLKPIDGPGMCGADFPLKVAALGESTMMSYADDLRPPASVPMPGVEARSASQSYPPLHPRAPVTSAPLAPSSRSDPQAANDGSSRYVPERARSQGRADGAYPSRYGAPDDADFVEDEPDDDIVREDTARAPARGQPAPRTTYDPGAPRNYPQVPLSPRRAAIQTTATVTPAATLACPIVSALDRWIVDSVQPAAQRWFNQPVTEIRQISAYSCRGMNGQRNARISEHAFGNALDIAAFTLADGRQITVRDGWRGMPEEQGFLRDVQAAACVQFTTVLAPGSNAFHYDHIHVDLMRRASGRTICEPEVTSGAEVAARAARSGGALAQRDTRYGRAQPAPPFDARTDPFAWRGPTRGRDGMPTGSIAASARPKPAHNGGHEPIDDENALLED
jgi:hypothetical protein